jgi:pimeloyl-ACP methyl ester carboxylesterase
VDASAVEFESTGGVVVRGERWWGSDEWCVFVHDTGEDLDAWRPLQGWVADQGRSAVVVDLRGHGGSDDGPEDIEADLAAAIRFARASGATAVCVIAAGAAARAALRGSPRPTTEMLVLLSPAAPGAEPVDAFRAPGVPRLFLYGAEDAAIDGTVLALRNAAIGWAGSIAFPTDAQGTALLASAWRQHVVEHITAFVNEQMHIACG